MGICYYKMVKKTLVLGASLNVDRYSNMAVKKLLLNNVDVRALGLRTGLIDKVFIEKDFVKFKNIHTVTLYLNSVRQEIIMIISSRLNPKESFLILERKTLNSIIY